MKRNLAHVLLVLLLIAGFVARLYKIDNPVADWHSWRQADTAAVTRNYVKYGVNLLYPRYDDMSDVSGTGKFNPNGYRFVEFPLFNVIHYSLLSSFSFGSLEYWGRLTSALSAILSGGLLYFLVRRHAGLVAAVFASCFYLLSPFNIYFTRVILPDPLMVSLFLLTLNFYDLSRSKYKYLFLILTSVFGGLSILVKPIAIFFLLPITFSMLKEYKLKTFIKPEFILTHLAFLLPFGIWRLWSYQYPEGVPTSAWLLNGNKIRFKPSFFQWMFGTRLGVLILGKFGIWPFMQGLVNSNAYMLYVALSAFIYVIVVATGNVQHDYYQIPIMPAVAALVGVGISTAYHTKTRNLFKFSLSIVCLVFALAFSWMDIKGLYQINNWSIVRAGVAASKILPSDAVVIAPYNHDTAFLYQTNRSGFPYLYKPLKDMIDNYNATYYISVNYDSDTHEIMEKYTVIEENPEFVIVKLIEKLR